MRRIIDPVLVAWMFLAIATCVNGQVPPMRAGVDTLVRNDGARVAGKLVGDAKAGFRFVSNGGAAPIALDGPVEVEIGGTGPGPSAGVPSVQVVLGSGQSISGGLVGIDETTLRLGDGPGGRPVAIDRRGVIALRQRPGEAMVLIDGFEAIDPSRWAEVGRPTVDSSTKLAGEKSLRIGADGSAVTASLPEPVVQGRLELAFLDNAAVVPGATWFVDLLFKGEHGPESLKAVLGWAEESYAVQSSGGPALAVQRLARKAAWHRLEVRFGPDAVEMALDGDALAHGKGPTGPLIEVRIGSSIIGKEPAGSLATHVDDLRVVRLASAVAGGEAEPDQDEVRLVEGDQVFGAIKAVDTARVVIEVLGRSVSIPWSGVSALHFRRDPKPSRVVDGLLATLEWRSAPGKDPRDLDRAEGAIVAADDQSFTLETPYAGTLVIPRDRLRRVVIDGPGRRIVVDPTAHHLGDEQCSRTRTSSRWSGPRRGPSSRSSRAPTRG